MCRASAAAATEPDRELLEPREVPLGGPRAMLVRRTLPNRDRRMVGAWCFADNYGPAHIQGQPGMQVPPHPHIGLQTVSWLLEGEVLHRDSLGTTQLIQPGELNLMTAGRGISHSEESPPNHGAVLHGAQLWVALPNEHRHTDPRFESYGDLPLLTDVGGTCRVLMGQVADTSSPARTYSPLVGADVSIVPGGVLRLPLEREFEHAVLALSEGVAVDGQPLTNGTMLYLGRDRRDVSLHAPVAARALLLGGTPFDEDLVMWWNFVGRSHEEVVEARSDWESGRAAGPTDRFGVVHGYGGPALAAPELPHVALKARSRFRRRET